MPLEKDPLNSELKRICGLEAARLGNYYIPEHVSSLAMAVNYLATQIKQMISIDDKEDRKRHAEYVHTAAVGLLKSKEQE